MEAKVGDMVEYSVKGRPEGVHRDFTVGKKYEVADLLEGTETPEIIVKDDKGKTLLDIPATVGIVGTIIAPWLAALGVIGALATNCTIVVERTIN